MPDPSADLVSLVSDNVRGVRARVDAAARSAGRDPSDVRLLVATKTQPAEAVRAVVAAGVDLVGENRVQELVAKAPDVADLVAAGLLRVHMIGRLQRNKINQVLTTASAVESVDSPELARALSARCVRDTRTLDVMLQVNVSGEPSKAGVGPDDAPGAALEVATLPGLRLTGFMTIGAQSPDGSVVRAGFARLREVRDAVVRAGDPRTRDARELSMGMSGDLELAIAEGATTVRVGTAVFGPRAVA
ncbi:YggS family pyridoxal phosphate-dependent enzyme [Cellulosimicrobium sp. NPDC057127]|uniref:YggS family pyridoxal phosphate-dependent enzyme n=1 Tax=Cellulosimicrobium sp. NPDC057127 TaxID=3346026 RepID=UPI003636E146